MVRVPGANQNVFITHEADVAAHAKRVIRLRDGKVQSDERHASIVEPPPRLVAGVPAEAI